ncbi:hypothetical protein B0H13DRAFT_2263554 [Mycena leptocephala]|nr:hypothetical protein B0H13DRAFT_2263554 [Mycena leptocephala]
MSVQVREIKTKRTKPRQEPWRAPATVGVRQDEVQTTGAPQFGSSCPCKVFVRIPHRFRLFLNHGSTVPQSQGFWPPEVAFTSRLADFRVFISIREPRLHNIMSLNEYKENYGNYG